MNIKYQDGRIKTLEQIEKEISKHPRYSSPLSSMASALVNKIKEQESIIEDLEETISDYQDYARGVAERRD